MIYIYSDFKDIFDVDHFKESLKEDIVIVDSLPPDYRRVKPYVRAPTSWSRVRVNTCWFYWIALQQLRENFRRVMSKNN